MRAILVLALIASAGASHAADRRTRPAPGVPYLVETARLTAAGWKPVALAGARGCPGDDVRCSDRPEARWCDASPIGTCGFTWTRNDRIVEVVTVGRAPARVVRTRCLNGNSCRSDEISGPTPGSGFRLF